MREKNTRPIDTTRRARRTIQRRSLYFLLIFGVFSFILLFTRIYDLTIVRHDEMQERAAKQQTQSTTISASRGTIYDRNGKMLAVSATADTVFLDPAIIKEYCEDLDRIRAEKMTEGVTGDALPISGEEYRHLIASTLAPILEIEEETILKAMEKTWSQYEVLKRRIEKEAADEIRAFIVNNPTGKNIRGIHLQSDAKRYYPYSNLASHALGFLNRDNHGAYGLEAIYNSELEGTNGLAVTARDANSQEILFQYEQFYDAENGNSLVLTIDSTIQYYVERGLEDMIARYGATGGATGIVMDVNTGALLAIASSPSYDLNSPWEIYDLLLQQQLTVEDGGENGVSLGDLQLKQWRNKAVNDTYEPGSTYKILTLAAALEEGIVTPNSHFNCTGSVVVDGWEMKCSRRTGHGNQDLATATANSCNPAFINIGLSVGTDTYYQYMKSFGLFEVTGVDLQGEAVGVAASEKNFQPIDLASYAFGQNFTVTPLQLIAAQASCVNGGYLYTPYVVEKLLDDNGNIISQHDSTPVRQVISEETSAIVREILEGVVANGTGRNGQVAGYRIGGKTGTADQGKTGNVVVSFLCFAPADDPQIIMLLTLDTPARDTGTYVSGGNMVAPTASSIMADILPYLGFLPQYSEEELASMDSTVPYVIGLNETDAAAKLREYGFTHYRVIGNGEYVTDQTPVGGAIVPASAEIILYMGAEKSAELCTVPDLTGLTAAQINKKLTEAGLIMKLTGASGDTAAIKAISQSHEPGAQVEAGTVITVQMGQSSTTAD